MTFAPDPHEPFGTMTPECVNTARAIHQWVRLAGIVSAVLGTCALVAIVATSGFAAASRPGERGAIVGAGTLQAVSVLAFLWSAFLLLRYSSKVEEAVQQRRAGRLIEAAPYERAYWALTVAYTLISLFSFALSVGAPAARVAVEAMQSDEEPPELRRNAPEPRAEEPEREMLLEHSLMLDAGAIVFVLAGAALMLTAVRSASSVRRSRLSR
jgi:hypothetical protein